MLDAMVIDIYCRLPTQAVWRRRGSRAREDIGIETVDPRNSKPPPLHLPQATYSLPRDREKTEKRSLNRGREACAIRFDPSKILIKIHEQPGQPSPLRPHVVVQNLLADDEPVKLGKPMTIEGPVFVRTVQSDNVEKLFQLGGRKAPHLVWTEGNGRKGRCQVERTDVESSRFCTLDGFIEAVENFGRTR